MTRLDPEYRGREHLTDEEREFHDAIFHIRNRAEEARDPDRGIRLSAEETKVLRQFIQTQWYGA